MAEMKNINGHSFVDEQAREDIEKLKEKGGLTDAQISALDAMFKVAAYTKADISAGYAAFKTAFGIEDTDEPVTPDKTLTGISATYSGGDVWAGALLTDLSGITVTAQYSDGTSEIVAGYTLSGEILEGENTITVMYNGATTTFIVTGLATDTDDTVSNDPPFDTAMWTEGLRITGNGKEYTGHANYATSSYIDVTGINSFTLARSDDVSGNVQYIVDFYDAEKAFVSGIATGYLNANGETYPASVVIDVPEGVTYCRLCGTKMSGIVINELIIITVNK